MSRARIDAVLTWVDAAGFGLSTIRVEPAHLPVALDPSSGGGLGRLRRADPMGARGGRSCWCSWGHLVRWHNETLARLVGEHSGEVIQTTGDGFFVTFDTPSEGIDCAVSIQRSLADHRREHGFSPRVRIGLHEAEATNEGASWSGAGVHIAARLGALADGEEILVSRGTAQAAGTSFGLSKPRSVSLKGISEEVEIVAVDWR